MRPARHGGRRRGQQRSNAEHYTTQERRAAERARGHCFGRRFSNFKMLVSFPFPRSDSCISISTRCESAMPGDLNEAMTNKRQREKGKWGIVKRSPTDACRQTDRDRSLSADKVVILYSSLQQHRSPSTFNPARHNGTGFTSQRPRPSFGQPPAQCQTSLRRMAHRTLRSSPSTPLV